jgi:hypothetical protein
MKQYIDFLLYAAMERFICYAGKSKDKGYIFNSVLFSFRNTCFKIMQLEFPALHLLVTEKTFMIATINSRITSYQLIVSDHTTGGNNTTFVTCTPEYSIFNPAPVVAMDKYYYRAKRFNGFVVTLANKQVRLYYENQIVSQFELQVSDGSCAIRMYREEPKSHLHRV